MAYSESDKPNAVEDYKKRLRQRSAATPSNTGVIASSNTDKVLKRQCSTQNKYGGKITKKG